jgi:hypothetical protein
VRSLTAGLPLDLAFAAKGQLAIAILTDAFADGLQVDFACGDPGETRPHQPEQLPAFPLASPAPILAAAAASGFAVFANT